MHANAEARGAVAAPGTPSLWMYAAAYGVALVGIWAAILGLEIDDPSFSRTVLALLTLGYAVSAAARGRPTATWGLAALLGSIVGVAVMRSVSGYDPLIVGSGADPHRHVGVLLVWLLVLMGFAQISAGWLLFTCVPTAALLGLVGSVYPEPIMTVLFMVFVSLASFLIIHEQHERMRARSAALATQGILSSRLLSQLYVAVACSFGAMMVGRVLADPMRSVGTSLLPVAAVSGAAMSPDRRALRTTVAVSENVETTVGNGPQTTSDQVLMRIRAEHGAYWRGATYDRYTGRGWSSSTLPSIDIGPRSAPGGSPWWTEQRALNAVATVPRTEINDVPGPSHQLRQYVRLDMSGRFSDIYGAGEVRSVRLSDTTAFGARLRLFADEAGRVKLDLPVMSTYYEVESEVPEWSPDALREAPDAVPGRISAMYIPLNVRAEIVEPLRTAALQATQGATNTYDRVVALQRFVSSTCKYNLAAEPIPTDAPDVASDFLFRTREGYCDLFATSLAVLCRSIDIPARVASGFNSGELEPESQYYVVRERDKHMWTEVYFAGVGWIPFDATTDAEDITPDQSNTDQEGGGSWLGLIFRRGMLPPAAILASLLLLGYALRTELRTRRGLARPASSQSEVGPNASEVLRIYGKMNARLRRSGLGRLPSETPLEHASRAAADSRVANAARHAPEALVSLVMRCRYAGYEPTLEEVTAARAAALAIRRAASSRRKERKTPQLTLREA